ncbi:MAG: DUF4162 domain-containing protein, partial [Pseudomonadota bacterium]
EAFGLKEFAKAKNESLSKGMAQKVQLLATIAHKPEFLILDEPFSGLDPINQRTLEDLIQSLKADGRTIIFSTHVMEHAERLCDRFLIMAKGQKRFEGTLDEARAALPLRVIVRTADPIAPLENAPGVVRVTPLDSRRNGEGGEKSYAIELAADADPQRLLSAALAAGVRLTKFEEGGVSLHEIFVTIAGETAELEDAA